jgi:putative OPT family oligopeptide transporter
MATMAPEKTETEHKPFVPDSARIPEFTWPAVIVGAVLGIIFGASSLYLVLKVGMTVSASIPVAVLSITLFRLFAKLPFMRRATILENNIVQTTGSAGESIAFGVGVTMPALMLIGFEMDVGRVMVVSVLGGLLGILMMIPLRRAFIVKQHHNLKYPEGTACADVLIVGEQGGATARTVFVGFGIAFLFQFLRSGLKVFQDTVSYPLSWFKGATPSLETDPALLGVGYIIGTRISCIMVAGGVLASFVLTPAIRLFGDGLKEPLYPVTDKIISKMSEAAIHRQYVLYIGAGAVAAGGIISLVQALPLIVSSFGAALRDLRRSGGGEAGGAPRTDRDLPLWIVGVGAVGLVLAIWGTTPLHRIVPAIPQLNMSWLGAILIVLFGFLFVTVSSRLTGEIGSSSNPISGMTVATLLLTCLIFLALGMTSSMDQLTALSIAGVVCIAASNGGTTSQDLKTGFLVGATPLWQQLAILVGALTSALAIGFLLIWLNNAYTIYTKKDLPTPNKQVDVAKLTETGKAPHDETLYHVLRVSENSVSGSEAGTYGLPEGSYLINDKGDIAYLVDPGINGTRTRRDDGTEVKKFTAPKATLMAFITKGILQQKLPWALVLLGVSITIVLELCGVSSLAFAVGVYLPLSTSAPIFVGGMVRYIADKWGQSANSGAPAKETDSDSSSGVLLSTGYIAGGAIAGVLIAFLNFNEDIPKKMSIWQYSHYALSREMPLDEAVKAAAENRLTPAGNSQVKQKKELEDLTDEIGDLNGDLPARYFRLKAGTTLELPEQKTYEVRNDTYLGVVAAELGDEDQAQALLDMNLGRLIEVPTAAELTLPKGREPPKFLVREKAPLGDVAKAALGDANKAQKLYELNKDLLAPKTILPAGAELKLPQRDLPGLAAFGVLVLFLVLVGLGWMLKSPPVTGPGAPAAHLSSWDEQA